MQSKKSQKQMHLCICASVLFADQENTFLDFKIYGSWGKKWQLIFLNII